MGLGLQISFIFGLVADCLGVLGLGLRCCLGFGLLFEVWTWLLFGLAVQQDLVGLLLLYQVL